MAAGNYKKAAACLPTTIQKALDSPRVCDLVKVVGKGKVEIFVKIELIKLSELISVSGNLTPVQAEFIASFVVDTFPNESLADFRLCFTRGCAGQYGQIYRMDGIVIREWMEKYLDEKYQVLEAELAKQKSGEYHEPIPPEEDGPGYQEFKKWAADLKNGAKVPDMPDSYYRKFGQEKPVRNSATGGYKYFPVKNLQIYALTQEHAEELVALMIKRGEIIEE